jgi:NAD(P)-dependent dehydrogenase (short-subunit alcohol dehydrogenase family)
MHDPLSPSLLDGRVALVTGGGRGLGLAIAEAFAAAGARGTVADRVEGSAPDGWLSLACDVTDAATIETAMARTVERYGRLDIVVANAGVVPPWSETASIDLDAWDRTFAVNVRGVVATIRTAVPHLSERGGSIVAMSSVNGVRGHPQQATYVASKHAVIGIVRSTALDLGRHRIRVNAIAPGPIATDALVGRIEARAAEGGLPADEALADYGRDTGLGRLATAEEVARTAVFLASDLASGVTGQVLPVDAGLA